MHRSVWSNVFPKSEVKSRDIQGNKGQKEESEVRKSSQRRNWKTVAP